MNRQETFELMRQAGFTTDWTGYANLKDTVAKYEKFAELVEHRTIEKYMPEASTKDSEPKASSML